MVIDLRPDAYAAPSGLCSIKRYSQGVALGFIIHSFQE
jgi:hypothetical protein